MVRVMFNWEEVQINVQKDIQNYIGLSKEDFTEHVRDIRQAREDKTKM